MKIQPVLNSCEIQMDNLLSKQLRSETLLALLKAARENNKNTNLEKKNYYAVEMMTDMDKNELRYELNYAIILLSDYQKTQSLSIAMPSNAYTQEFADKLNSIKEGIETIINKFQADKSE
jgi:DNA-dependent RNA polymerase auxiliary subunit epsilon